MTGYTGALEPDEFIIVQDVFKRITQDAWFRDDSDKLDWFGRVVFHAYQGGITDNDRLYEHCLEASRLAAEGSPEFQIL
jgi:hypothetical protein